MGPFGGVGSRFVVDSCEDLVGNGGLGMEIVRFSKKVDFWFYFRRFGFVSLVAPSEDVVGCSGDGRGVDLAALWG